MKRVLIEFFDKENLNNCVSQLHETFDRVIYLYLEFQRNARTEPVFSALINFNRIRAGVEPEFIPVKNRDVDSVLQILSGLINAEDEFRFDITGGRELFIIAAGMFLGSYGGKNISVIQYSVRSGKAILRYPPDSRDPEKNYFLSVRELIALHGSAVEEGNVRHDLKKGGFGNDLIKFWNAVKKQNNIWNKFCCLPNFKRSAGGTVFFRRTASAEEKKLFKTVTDELADKKLITVLSDETVDGVNYSSFVSRMTPDADFLFDKGGNILEMISYLAVKTADPDADVLVSVPVDWDGVVSGEPGETKNEIDLIASDGRTPVFISCKNTEVTNSFLYELQSVTAHYGGRYAKCVLISTVHNSVAIRSRARAMGIELVDEICAESYEKFFKRIKEVCFPEDVESEK